MTDDEKQALAKVNTQISTYDPVATNHQLIRIIKYLVYKMGGEVTTLEADLDETNTTWDLKAEEIGENLSRIFLQEFTKKPKHIIEVVDAQNTQLAAQIAEIRNSIILN